MNQEIIKWKMKGFGKGISPAKAATELKRISIAYNGALTPENVVAEAKKKSSILHKFFEWNDDKAAEQYRLQQARNLINNIQVTVVAHGKSRDVGAFEVVSITGGGRAYKSIDVMTINDINQVRIATLADMQRIKEKLEYYTEFKPAVSFLGRAIKYMSKKS